MGRWLKGCLKRIFSFGDRRPGKACAGQDGETRVLQPAYTMRLKPDQESQQAVPDGANGQSDPLSETSIEWCGLTDTGRVRNHNEDYFSCGDLRDATLFVVADGMGGHDAGEVASRLAVEAVSREIHAGTTAKFEPRRLLEQAVQRANDEVLHQAGSTGSNMGTTLTLALVHEDKAYIANVGDSRTYWIENGFIRRITEDHSLVEKLVSAGKLTKEEARKHPKSNVLYRNIGSEAPVKVDTFEVMLNKGGSLLLCTDGLWGEVIDEDIHKVFLTEKDARTACTRLIDLANKNGGKDNITAVVVRVV